MYGVVYSMFNVFKVYSIILLQLVIAGDELINQILKLYDVN